MKFYLKTLFRLNIFLANIDYSLGLRFEEIVRLDCDVCQPQTNTCCVGTVIYKNTVLTTSYCAEVCQFVKKGKTRLPITKTYLRNNYAGKGYVDIGIIIVENLNLSKSNGVQISAVDALSTIGLMGLYPALNDGGPKMQRTIINRCGEETRSFDYYLCGSKKMVRTSTSCFQVQGVPLLLNGKIIAVSASTNNLLCGDEHIFFTVLSPVISWISSIVNLYKKVNSEAYTETYRKASKYRKHMLDKAESTLTESSCEKCCRKCVCKAEVKHENIAMRTPPITEKTTLTTTTSGSSISTLPTIDTSIPVKQVAIMRAILKDTTHKELILTSTTSTKVSTTPTTVSNVSTSISTSTITTSAKLSPPSTSTIIISSASTTTTADLTFTFPSANVISTFTSPSANVRSTFTSPSANVISTFTSPSANVISTLPHTPTTKPVYAKSTNAMDWFNANIRNKIGKKAYLVLTTDTAWGPPFVDLT